MRESLNGIHIVRCKFHVVPFILFLPWVGVGKLEEKHSVLLGQCSLGSQGSLIEERIILSVSSNFPIAATINRGIDEAQFSKPGFALCSFS